MSDSLNKLSHASINIKIALKLLTSVTEPLMHLFSV